MVADCGNIEAEVAFPRRPVQYLTRSRNNKSLNEHLEIGNRDLQEMPTVKQIPKVRNMESPRTFL